MANERGVGFEESEWFGGRGEAEFAGVIGIVETEGEDDAGNDRREPDDGGVRNEAAVFEAQLAVFGDSVVNAAGIGYAGVFHAATTLFSMAPTPGISTRTTSPGAARGEVSGSPTRRMSPARRVMNSEMSWIR
jgi:hypothetical protein